MEIARFIHVDFFRTNKWISTGKTLIIGYDVCHPEPQPKHERRLKMAQTQPSVLGISFNGAFCPETFIGDYAFQQPRQEQATGSILEERIFWILSLFQKNRGTLPDMVIITRDGVSEGQYKMVKTNMSLVARAWGIIFRVRYLKGGSLGIIVLVS